MLGMFNQDNGRAVHLELLCNTAKDSLPSRDMGDFCHQISATISATRLLSAGDSVDDWCIGMVHKN